jgi:hypothetical protein
MALSKRFAEPLLCVSLVSFTVTGVVQTKISKRFYTIGGPVRLRGTGYFDERETEYSDYVEGL